MNNAQKHAIRAAKERGTQPERDAAMIVNASPLMVRQNNLYPNQGLPIEQQIEPILFTMCIWGEARGEDTEGIQSVAAVIVNRAEANRSYFGKNVRDVVLKHNEKGVYQFSAMRPDEVNYNKMKTPDMLSWLKVAAITFPIYMGGLTCLPVECLYYTTLENTYFDNNDKVELFKTHGNHKFYIDK